MNDIKVLYEDDDILVLDKPSGVIVNKADTTKGELTVQDWLEKRWQATNDEWRMADKESDFYKRAGIVHRIDKETSGILVVAKNLLSFTNLQAQFKDRKVEKTYVALAHGRVEPIEGEISVPVGRLPWNRSRFGVLAGGKEAVTKYKAIGNFWSPIKKQEQLTLLELYPKTGRTHQIRVHLKYINHPIFGDELYAGRKTSRDDRKILPRFFLHAKTINFFHPKTGKRVKFESELPEELQNIVDVLSR
ncbi:MAG: RluA family pseudouridine synthase [Candidatus Levyibacteriota bacterium]|jgi:23S rRNA pseudouridine1911/1915/1917 synthase